MCKPEVSCRACSWAGGRMLAQTFRKDKTGQFSLPGVRTGDLSPGARLQQGKSRLSCQQLRTQTQVSKGSACDD